MAYHQVNGSKKNRIHYSGPLMPHGGNMEEILKEHERQIQQAVRRARMDNQARGTQALRTDRWLILVMQGSWAASGPSLNSWWWTEIFGWLLYIYCWHALNCSFLCCRPSSLVTWATPTNKRAEEEIDSVAGCIDRWCTPYDVIVTNARNRYICRDISGMERKGMIYTLCRMEVVFFVLFWYTALYVCM